LPQRSLDPAVAVQRRRVAHDRDSTCWDRSW
jgi:hypothetical protein